jgi:hypothetical protein
MGVQQQPDSALEHGLKMIPFTDELWRAVATGNGSCRVGNRYSICYLESAHAPIYS